MFVCGVVDYVGVVCSVVFVAEFVVFRCVCLLLCFVVLGLFVGLCLVCLC